jgi:hypothetical protein
MLLKLIAKQVRRAVLFLPVCIFVTGYKSAQPHSYDILISSVSLKTEPLSETAPNMTVFTSKNEILPPVKEPLFEDIILRQNPQGNPDFLSATCC